MANMTFACHSIVPLGLNHSRSYCFSGTRSSLRTELDCGWEGERALHSTLGRLQQLQQQLRGGSFRSCHQPLQGEESEEDAENLHWEADDHVRVQVARKSVVAVAVPPTNISHTYPIQRSAQHG